jgi:O-antigen/teichoic acid export membrane protein
MSRAFNKIISAIIKFDSKIIIAISTMLFISCSISFILGRQDLADSLAFVCFYFLILATIFMIIQHFKEPIQQQILDSTLLSNRFFADNMVMLVAVVAINLFRYGYQLAMGIMLSAENYGLLMSLVSLFIIITVLTQTVTAVVTKTTATLNTENQSDSVGSFYRITLKFNFLLGIVMFVILAATSVFISRLLNLGSAFICIILFSSLLFAFPLASNWGIMQGLQKFVSLGSSQVLFQFLQTLIAVLLVALGMKVAGGIAAMPISYLIVLVVSVFLLRKLPMSSPSKVSLNGIGRYALHALLAFTAITVMTNVDVVIARLFLTPVDAGNYSAVSVLGRIAFYAPAGIAAVLFPKSAETVTRGEDSTRHYRWSLILTVLIVAIICLVYWMLPGTVMHILFAGRYQNAAPYLVKYGLGMSFLAVTFLCVNYGLSIGKTGIAYLMLAVMTVQLGLLIVFHQSISDFVDVILISGGLSMVTILLSIPILKKHH